MTLRAVSALIGGGGGGGIAASSVSYSNTTSGLNATNVQAAVDEIVRYSLGITPFQFGAVGDWNGTTGTDDTAAIQD